MTKKTKSVKAYRAEIVSFEKDQTTPYYLYQAKEYNENGLITHETEYKANGLKELEISFEYDGLHNLISKQTYYPLEETLEKLIHVYDHEGRKLREENYFGEDIFETLVYGYDSIGNIIYQARMDDEDVEIEKQESEFDEKGRLVKQKKVASGEPDHTIAFEYGETGLCTKETHTYSSKRALETVEYAYNELGKRTTAVTKDKEDDIIGYLDVEYDEKMNPVKYISETSGFYNSKAITQIVYDDQGRTIETEYFDVLNNFLMSKETYLYDENGNIIEEEIFETNPMAGLKKTHYRLKLEYIYWGE